LALNVNVCVALQVVFKVSVVVTPATIWFTSTDANIQLPPGNKFSTKPDVSFLQELQTKLIRSTSDMNNNGNLFFIYSATKIENRGYATPF
jgi:hypothetical protein